MTANHDPWRPHFRDIPAAIGLLTRIPVRLDMDWSVKRGANGVWAYPFAGLVLGCAVLLVAQLLTTLGLPEVLAATLLVAIAMFFTGAMHEDGFADTLDGFWGGWSKQQRLEIMKDSSIGVYGVCGLCLAILAKVFLWSELLLVLPSAILGGAILSRALMPALMWVLPHARENGLSKTVGRPPAASAAISVLAGLFAGALLGGALAVVVACLVAVGLAAIAKFKVGGQTGDVLGACQMATELTFLVALTAKLA